MIDAVGDLGRPAAAVDHQDGGEGGLGAGGGGREPQVGDLQRVGAVGIGAGRRGARAGEEGGPGHDGGLGGGLAAGAADWGALASGGAGGVQAVSARAAAVRIKERMTGSPLAWGGR